MSENTLYLYMYIFKEKKNQNTHQNDLSLGYEDFHFNAQRLEPTCYEGLNNDEFMICSWTAKITP